MLEIRARGMVRCDDLGMWTDIIEGTLRLLAPGRCAACDQWLPGGRDGFCACCGPLLEPVAEPSAQHPAHAAYLYGGPMAEAIKRFKYGGRVEFGNWFGAHLGAAACRWGPDCDLVLPVPLHPSRLRARGYNQSAILARVSAGVLGLPWRAGLLRRCRDTPSQAGLDREVRVRNLRGAFRARPAVGGRKVLLVDDVRTTGATLEAAGAALRGAGAVSVHGLVLARAESGGVR